MNPEEKRSVREVGMLLSVLAGLLVLFQYTTMAAFTALGAAVTSVTLPEYFVEVREHVEFDWYDGLQVAAMVGIATTLTLREIRGRRLSSFFAYVFASERRTLWFLGACALVCARFYVATGNFPWAADQPQHIIYTDITARALGNAELPIWTNYLGCGTPYLQFYGFLFFYFAGALQLVLGDLFTSLKVAMLLGHAASGLTMYLFVRTTTRSRRAGFVAGIAFVLSFWHTQQVLIMGRLPLSLFYAVLPLAFYFTERTLRRQRWFDVLAGGICLGTLAFIHPGYALWATALYVLYALVRLVQMSAAGHLMPAVLHIAALFVAGIAFGAYLTLPMWLERDFTGLYRGVDFTTVPDPSWSQVFGWSNYRFWILPLPEVHWYGGYVGLSLVALVLGGSGFAARRWAVLARNAAPAVWTCLAASTLIVFAYRWPPVQALPFIEVLASGRYLLFLVFFLSAATGMAAQCLISTRAGAGTRNRVLSFLVLLIAWDLVPTTFQHPYGVTQDTDAWGKDLAQYGAMRDSAASLGESAQLPATRVFWAWGAIHPYLAKGQLYYNTLTPSPHALHPGASRAVADFVAPLELFLSAALEEMPTPAAKIALSEDIALIHGAIVMMNARFLFATQVDGNTIGMRWPFSTPVLVSSRLATYDSPRDSAWIRGELSRLPISLRNQALDDSTVVLEALDIVRQTGVGYSGSTCQQILVRDSGPRDLRVQPSLEVSAHTVANQHVEMTLRMSSAGFVRLPYSYFPHLRVRVDGVEVKPYQTAGRFIALQLDPGEHVITLDAVLSPLRRLLLLLDVAMLVAAAYCCRRRL